MKHSLLALLTIVTAFALSAHSAEVRTKVKYIAADATYIDAGSIDGIKVGDRADVLRKEQLIAVLEVVFVADNSASCRLLESTAAIQVGDEVAVHVTADSAATPSDQVIPQKALEAPPAKPSTKKSVKTNRLTGKVSVELYRQDDLEASNNDLSQPAFVVNSRLMNIGGSGYAAGIRLRARRNNRSGESASESQWNNRLYEAALFYDDPNSAYRFSAGRFSANSLSGIGIIDGALLSRKVQRDWSIGGFTGTQPDLRNTKFQTDEVKAGIFARWSPDNRSSARRYSGTIAAAGDYVSGNINREFLYQQLQYSSGGKWSLYESSEINLNRDWKRDAEGSSFTWSSFLLNANWNPVRTVGLDFGYDNRRNFRYYDSRGVADSLFDDATRQGLRAGVRVRFAHRYYAGASGNLRAKENDFSAGKSATIHAGSQNLLSSGTLLELRYTGYDNEYSKGSQPSIRISRAMSRALSFGLESGIDSYRIESLGMDQEANWTRLSADARLNRHWYTSAYGEVRRGADAEANHWLVELGYRF